MTVSRIAFALDDLEREIRGLCGFNPAIALRLDPASYDRVVSALADHTGSQLPAGGAAGTTRHGGISIIRVDLKLPHKFLQVHQREIETCWHKYGAVFRINPKEPLGHVSLDGPVAGTSVTVVSIRCVNDRGTLRAEAFSAVDLKAAEEWTRRHRDTPDEDFTWLPDIRAVAKG